MTDELIKLRHEVYRCASLFHGAMAQYFAALNSDASAGAVSGITVTAREAGQDYNAALVALLKNLKSLPASEDVSREAERAERTISILSFEVQRL
jgi:hypothetical protein